jgi:uncharacterized protein with HEPN domain
MKEDIVYLDHILECLRRLEEIVAAGRDTFMSSYLHQDAALRNLQTMAESTQRLSDKVKLRQPQIEWQEIAAFRNVLTHDCVGIQLDVVWIILTDKLPSLREAILVLYDENRDPEDEPAP